MRNRYPGTCYRCGERVEAGEGHFERHKGAWRTQHASCAIKYRGQPTPERLSEIQAVAAGTGIAAQRARRRLRNLTIAQGTTND